MSLRKDDTPETKALWDAVDQAVARGPSYLQSPGRHRFRTQLFERVEAELARAYGKHGAPQWGRHEFYGVLKEEVDELWETIKRDEPQERLEEELVQVAAMCFRYYETRDRYREPA